MKLIAGLGNPGEKYLLTPHNIGYMTVDAVARHQDLKWSLKKKHSAWTAAGSGFLLAKPGTYMNLSGTALKSLIHYYRVNLDQLLIIHDDLDLPFLSRRWQKNRGPAGHNGLKNINQELKSQNYARLRIGVKTENTQEASFDRSQRVLKPFTKREREILPDFLNNTVSAILYFIKEGLEKTANRCNRDPYLSQQETHSPVEKNSKPLKSRDGK